MPKLTRAEKIEAYLLTPSSQGGKWVVREKALHNIAQGSRQISVARLPLEGASDEQRQMVQDILRNKYGIPVHIAQSESMGDVLQAEDAFGHRGFSLLTAAMHVANPQHWARNSGQKNGETVPLLDMKIELTPEELKQNPGLKQFSAQEIEDRLCLLRDRLGIPCAIIDSRSRTQRVIRVEGAENIAAVFEKIVTMRLSQSTPKAEKNAKESPHRPDAPLRGDALTL